MKWSGTMSKLINELQDGDKETLTLLVQQVTKGVTAKGAPYLSFQLQDKTGLMDAKYWSVTQEELDMYKAGMIGEFKCDVLSHNKQLQLRIHTIEILDRSQVDLAEYVQSAPLSRAELKVRIEKEIASIENEKLKAVIEKLVGEYGLDFYSYPAASKNHHAFVGGLAFHILSMIDLANAICKLYPLLDRDLLVSGVILHDLGKLVELSGPVITEYTMEGKLLGHISIMQAKVMEAAHQLGIEGEEIILLRHMILSHHGKYEYGSPVLPLIPEAEILNYIDNMDARMNTFERTFEQVEPGEFTPRIFSLENRSFYKSKNKK